MYIQDHTYLTQKGLQMSLAAHNGQPLHITRITVGDGAWPTDADPRLIQALMSPKRDAKNLFAIISEDKTLLRVQAVVDNEGVTEGFAIRETGIFASAGGEEILFAIILNPDRPDYVWPQSAGVSNHTNIDVLIRVVDSGDIVVVPGSEPYVTVSYFNEVIAQLRAMFPIVSDTEPINQPVGGIWHDTSGKEETQAPGYLLVDDYLVTKGSIELDDGSVKDLTLIVENSG